MYSLGARWSPCRFILLLFAVLHPAYLRSQGIHDPSSSKPANNESKLLQLRFRLEIVPHDKKSHDTLMTLLKAKNAFRAEIEEDGKWLKNNPGDWEAQIEMSSLAKAAVDDPEYAFEIDRFILTHTKREDDEHSYDFAAMTFAFELLERRHFSEGLDILRKQTVQSPSEPAVWENLGDALVRAEHAEEAIPALKKSIELDPTQENPHEGLAKAYLRLARYAEAETEYKAALSLYDLQFHRGVPTDSFHQMMKGVQTATNREPMLADLHYHLSQVYLGAQEYAKALAELDGAEKANPDDQISYEYARAHIYDKSGQTEMAEAVRVKTSKLIRDEMKKERRDPDMDKYMAYPEPIFMSLDGDPSSSAQEIITFYAPIQPSSLKPMDLLTLGTAYCAVGNADLCVSYTEGAFRTGEKLNRAEAHHKLAMSLLDLHDSPHAFKHFQAAYELDPANTTYRLDFDSMKTTPGSN